MKQQIKKESNGIKPSWDSISHREESAKARNVMTGYKKEDIKGWIQLRFSQNYNLYPDKNISSPGGNDCFEGWVL